MLIFGSTAAWAQTPGQVLDQAWEDVNQLAGDAFFGRGYQQKGHLLAADYIASRMQEMGLKPIPGNDSETPYFQEFDLALYLPEAIDLTAKEKSFTIGKDYIVNTLSGSGNIRKAKTIDIGYGMPDDYADFTDQIVIIRAGLAPEISKSDSLKKIYKDYAGDDYKIVRATQSGAAGIILLKDKLTAGYAHQVTKVPVFDMLADAWPGKVKKMNMCVEVKPALLKSQNVIGWVEGKTAPDSVILVSAHYDHLGMQGSAIFNGANDNASGTAVILSLAKHFVQNPPKYSMAFIGFGGEEAGLLGSRHYVTQNPVWPLAQTKFILNLDLMGNGDEGITAVGGRVYPETLAMLRELNESLGTTPKVKARGNAANSDHYYFLKNGVPGFFIFTMGGPPHYHDVNDVPENLRFSRFHEMNELLIQFLGKL